ncbi:MAG TPA: dTDP-4-dehydrorhamnose reductase [Bacillota bacterium]|nr:dTDP-4-dehydrorhamnose reductase [Bacillota bacterium]HQQ44145.1 dTDP-4-dehydrorhamnose reductase [Bacillota bacterium]
MKMLITGAAGQLGSELLRITKEMNCSLGAIDRSYNNPDIMALGAKELDIADLPAVRNIVGRFRPDVIINTAAYTNVDGCEKEAEAAFKVNALGARNVAIAAQETNSKLIHISTDYVFPGGGSTPYREYDKTSPKSIYGKTKLLGEEYVREFCKKYFIIRTSWLYGRNGRNFVRTILSEAKEKQYLEVVDDQKGCPTNAEDLAYHILKIAVTDEYGVYHCSGNGECSWYEFAIKILEIAGIDCPVKPIKTNQLDRAAERPAYSVMDNMMLRLTVGDDMRSWEAAIEHFIKGLLI